MILGYQHEKLDYSDDQWNHYQYVNSTSFLSGTYADEDYDINVGYIKTKYSFYLLVGQHLAGAARAIGNAARQIRSLPLLRKVTQVWVRRDSGPGRRSEVRLLEDHL